MFLWHTGIGVLIDSVRDFQSPEDKVLVNKSAVNVLGVDPGPFQASAE